MSLKKTVLSLQYCTIKILFFLATLVYFRKISRNSRLSHDLVVHRDSKDNNEQTPFEFTEANMTRLCALIKNYPEGSQRSAVGAALDLVQRQIGWVPISAMNKVAEILSMPRMRVYEYATFYTMVKRSFKGKYHVKVCSTTPCMIMGSDIILEAVEQVCECKVGHVSKDGLFGVDIVQCQGACANAPVLVVDDDYYEDVTVCDVQNIICTIKNGGIPQAGPRAVKTCLIFLRSLLWQIMVLVTVLVYGICPNAGNQRETIKTRN